MEAIRERAGQYARDFVHDLEQIVNVDSGTFDKPGVDRAGALLAGLLQGLGCEIVVRPGTTHGDSFTGTLRGRGSRRLMLLGHVDTVYPAGTAAEHPFTVRDGRGYGPGAMDMKGGLILGYCALRALRDLGSHDFAEITFVVNGDEEIGSPTSRELIESEAARMDVVFVLEPCRVDGGVLATRKGVAMYRLEVCGRAAHAGAAPREGASATLELAHQIVALDALNDADRGTTVSVTVIGGGTRRNVIPAEAHAEIDVRVVTVDEARRVDLAMRGIAARPRVPGTVVSLDGGLNRPPMEKTAATRVLLSLAREVVTDLGGEFQELTSGGGSDGNYTAALGIPTLDALGPVGQNAHRPDEFVELGSVPLRIALLAALLDRVPRRLRSARPHV